MLQSIDPTPLIIALAVLGIAAMLLITAAAIRQGVAAIDLEYRVRALQESQRQQLIAKGVISDVIEVDEVEDIAEESDGGPAAAPSNNPGSPTAPSAESAPEPARKAA